MSGGTCIFENKNAILEGNDDYLWYHNPMSVCRFLTTSAQSFLSLLILFRITSAPNRLPMSFKNSTISDMPKENILKR